MDDLHPGKPPFSEDSDTSPSCTFCQIIRQYPPSSPNDPQIETVLDPNKVFPPAYILLSTKNVVAFLDIAPLTRGHVLVAPRKHRVRIGDLTPSEMAQVGRVLPLLARSIIKAVLPDIPHDEADYNVVQNNGPGAAQVIPHVHFHIIPRPPLDYQPPSRSLTENPSTGRTKYGPSKLPTGLQASYIQFGRGMRNELDEEDAAVLVKDIRFHIGEQWQRELGNVSENNDGIQGRRSRRSPEKL